MAKVAFIGLGNMGLPMAKNLLEHGHDVIGFDLVDSSMAAFSKIGGKVVGSAVECIKGVEIVVTMLPEGRHVDAVYTDSILRHGDAGSLLIDCSTIDVDTARAVAHSAEENGFEMVDAPVSGGTGGAEAGTLTFMVGGTASAYNRALPILEPMGSKIVHTGGAGNGQAAKICNNMILVISIIAVSESFSMAEKLGLDAQTLFDITSSSSSQCWAMTSYLPVAGPVPASPANRNYSPGFTTAMMAKDMKLAQDAASSTGQKTELASHALEMYKKYIELGGAPKDFSGIYTMISDGE